MKQPKRKPENPSQVIRHQQAENSDSNEHNESLDDALQIIEAAETVDPKIFAGLPKEKVARAFSIGMSMSRVHSGPLPHPDTVEGYGRVINNGAERVMLMAEKEQAARLEDRAIIRDRSLNQSRNGQIFGFVLCMTAILGGIYLSANGMATAGVVAIIGALVALAGAFIYGKYQEGKDK